MASPARTSPNIDPQAYPELGLQDKIERAALEGDVDMMFQAALNLHFGNKEKGIMPDLKAAKKLYKRSAALGHLYASYQLAGIYLGLHKKEFENLEVLQRTDLVAAQALFPIVLRLRERFCTYVNQGIIQGYSRSAYMMGGFYLDQLRSAEKQKKDPREIEKLMKKTQKYFSSALLWHNDSLQTGERLKEPQLEFTQRFLDKYGQVEVVYQKMRIRSKDSLQLQAAVEALEKTRVVLRREVQSLSLEKETLLEEKLQSLYDLREAESYIAKKEEELKEREAYIADSQDYLESEEARIAQALEQIHEKEQSLAEGQVSAQLEEEKEAMLEQQRDIQRARQELEKQEEKLSQDREAFERERQEMKEAQELLDETFKKDLDEKYQQLEAEKAKIEQEDKALKIEQDKNRQELEKIEQERRQIEADRLRLEREITADEANLAAAKRAFAEQSKSVEAKAKHEGYEAALKKNRSEMEKLKARNEELSKKKKEAEQERDRLNKMLQEITSHASMIPLNDEKYKDLKRLYDKLQAENRSLNDALRVAFGTQRRLEAANRHLEKVKNSVTTYKQMIDYLNKSNLSLAIATENVALIEKLIREDYDLNEPDVQGNTSIHLALQLEKAKVAELLLAQTSLKVDVLNKKGELPLELALKCLPKKAELHVQLATRAPFLKLAMIYFRILEKACQGAFKKELFDSKANRSVMEKGGHPKLNPALKIESGVLGLAAFTIQIACLKAFILLKLSTEQDQLDLCELASKLLQKAFEGKWEKHQWLEPSLLEDALENLRTAWTISVSKAKPQTKK